MPWVSMKEVARDRPRPIQPARKTKVSIRELDGGGLLTVPLPELAAPYQRFGRRRIGGRSGHEDQTDEEDDGGGDDEGDNDQQPGRNSFRVGVRERNGEVEQRKGPMVWFDIIPGSTHGSDDTV